MPNITKKDYFAAQALTAIITNNGDKGAITYQIQRAYDYAHQMMLESERQSPEKTCNCHEDEPDEHRI